MLFYGTPREAVRVAKPKRGGKGFDYEVKGRFNAEGHFETDDPALIERLKRKYEWYNPEAYHCTKCDFQTTRRGEFSVHYRHKHPRPIYDDWEEDE